MSKDPSSTSSRSYPPRPVLGVGALLFEADSVLLVKRGNQPLQGYWSLPGGAVETGETLAAAIARECLEETGLEVEPLLVAEIFERMIADAEGRTQYHYVLIDYLCRRSGGVLAAGSDSAETAFVRLDALHSLLLTEGTLEVIERTFERYGTEQS